MGKIKVVINDCYGGFSLSSEAIKYLVQKKSELIKAIPFQEWTEEPTEKDYFTIDIGDGFKAYRIAEDILLKDDIVYEYIDANENRAHPDLIEVVEKLGKEAWGDCAKLKIVEIPNDADWTICDYDGAEWVAEKHRTWE